MLRLSHLYNNGRYLRREEHGEITLDTHGGEVEEPSCATLSRKPRKSRAREKLDGGAGPPPLAQMLLVRDSVRGRWGGRGRRNFKALWERKGEEEEAEYGQ